jgi:hypothetical protein
MRLNRAGLLLLRRELSRRCGVYSAATPAGAEYRRDIAVIEHALASDEGHCINCAASHSEARAIHWRVMGCAHCGAADPYDADGFKNHDCNLDTKDD